jgi:hypothetical protein
MKFFRERKLSQAASDLIQFDADSIRQVVSAQHLANPDVWLVDPDAYEKNGRVLRDSESPRLLAYSTKDQVLFATDGCNSCTRRVRTNLAALPSSELKEFAEHNAIRHELLERLVTLINAG